MDGRGNKGYSWSVALLICSAVFLALYVCAIAATLTHPQAAPAAYPLLRPLARMNSGFAVLALVIAIAGMSARRWKSRNTRGLFILGLIDAALFIGTLAHLPQIPAGNGAYLPVYSLLCFAFLVCLIGYSLSFKVKKQRQT